MEYTGTTIGRRNDRLGSAWRVGPRVGNFTAPRPPPGKWTFLGISLFDFNENYISDFRADIVPLGAAFTTLHESQSSGAHSKRVLAQYPIKYIRTVFPTAGRSTAVMVGIRAELKSLLRRRPTNGEETDRPVISTKNNPHQEGIDAWTPARLLRNLGPMRSRIGSQLVYGGQKWHSLLRYVERGSESGQVILVVIPESPTYRAELVTPAALQQFETRLAELQKRYPDLVCVRLDQAPELRSDALYWDLVHLNAPGQEIATKVLLARLKETGIQR
jgi:hypothetical protein